MSALENVMPIFDMSDSAAQALQAAQQGENDQIENRSAQLEFARVLDESSLGLNVQLTGQTTP